MIGMPEKKTYPSMAPNTVDGASDNVDDIDNRVFTRGEEERTQCTRVNYPCDCDQVSPEYHTFKYFIKFDIA